MHTFTYQKALLHTLLLLVSKIVESLQCIFNMKYDTTSMFIFVLMESLAVFGKGFVTESKQTSMLQLISFF